MSTTGAVLITGTSTGIGRATALKLDQMGFQVFAGVRKEEDATALQQVSSERLTPLLMDVTDPATVQATLTKVATLVGEAGLAGLVNNAGFNLAGPLECIPLGDIEELFAVNVFGLLTVTRASIPLLRQAQGRIINVGSGLGRLHLPFWGPYAAAKAAVWAITNTLRVELRPWKIAVSLVEPAEPVASPLHSKLTLRFKDHIAPGMAEYYHPIVAPILEGNALFAAHGMSPEAVAEVIADALATAEPQALYSVARSEQGEQLLHLLTLPDEARDPIVAQFYPAYP
jgi:NAD(P)-dependent dehydrogenase (short-subunit alcohol dehydrogenase family)